MRARIKRRGGLLPFVQFASLVSPSRGFRSCAGTVAPRPRRPLPSEPFRITIPLEIHPSARRHGIADEDIEHAVANAMAVDDQDGDTRLYLGPARNADLLEVATIVRDDGTELAIHAMKMRPKYGRLLPGE